MIDHSMTCKETIVARAMLSQHFCTKCGTEVDLAQQICANCGFEFYARSLPLGNEDLLQDSDATIRRSSYEANQLLNRYIQATAPENNVTVEASVRLSSRAYLNAAKHAVSDTLPQIEVPSALSSVPARNTKGFKKGLFVRIGCVIGLVCVIALFGIKIIDQGSDTHAEQEVSQNKVRLDQLMVHASSIGVPASFLQPVLKKEQQLDRDQPLFLLFHSVLSTDFYANQVKQYQTLQKQVVAISNSVTELLQAQAQRDMQDFQISLLSANAHPVGNIHYFSQQFSQDLVLLEGARTPGDYTKISANARQSIDATYLLTATFTKLTDFDDTLESMERDHIDMTAMQEQYQNDLSSFDQATRPLDFQNINALLDAQYQQLIVESVRAFPYVSVTKLNEFTKNIQELKMYGINSASYQKRLNADEVIEVNARTVYDEVVFLKQIDTDISSMHDDLVRGEARYLVGQFHQEVSAWAKAHAYSDAYDGRDYAPDNGYSSTGIGVTIDNDLASASTAADFETMISEVTNALFNLHMFEGDYNDHTPYNKVHSTDMQMINHYNLGNKQILMVSLAGQAMRVYQDGHLVRGYQATTGRQELPSLPGVWSVLDRKSPTIFKAGEPQGSPYWFPDTPINYAILYHYGGYFVHDAPWRADFGPGTQYPHEDASGTTAYNFDGSHGCINLQEDDAAWVYHHTDWNTVIVIY